MRDKITRLSKGITDIEAPVIEIMPEFFSDTIILGHDNGFILELISTNGCTIKGICFTDEPRISAEPRAFSGRRIHININVNTCGLEENDVLKGQLTLVTNGGERFFPYTFTAGKGEISLIGAELMYADLQQEEEQHPAVITEDNPLSFDVVSHDAEPETDEELKEQMDILCSELPEDEALFDGVLAALIRSENRSLYAFRMYTEAIKRGININRLYESYVYAYPDDCGEAMPREVFIYFSYESSADRGILRKLYANVLDHMDRDSELYAYYEQAMGSYAIGCALERRIDDELVRLYDRMLYPGMVDPKAAEILPDIFKCCRISVSSGDADFLTVSYRGLNGSVHAEIISGVSFVPIYFKDADIHFFKTIEWQEPQDVTDSVSYESRELFARPDMLKRCFELVPEHRMLLLSAIREIADRGLNSENEIAVVLRGLKELDIDSELRGRLIDKLCDFGSSAAWKGILKVSDYEGLAGGRLFGLLADDPDNNAAEAWNVLKQRGVDKLNYEDAAKLAVWMIANGHVPHDKDGIQPYFVAVCKYLYDKGISSDVLLDFLAEEYEGGSEEMYALVKLLLERGRDIAGLPEKILTVKLFAGTKEHIDECFGIYIEHCAYTELVVRAYLTVRCADAFLHEEDVDRSVYEALDSYVKGSSDPVSLPLIYRLALTAHYADAESLDNRETELCQTIMDDLIATGLVFRYTKKLRKKIRIPEDICSRFYVQFNAPGDDVPKLLTRILPDNTEYRVTDMHRVYKNIYVMSTVLFKGDKLQYIIYNSDSDEHAAEEGMISVAKYHRQRDEVFASLDTMTKAIEDKDIGLLKETMLEYAERTEMIKLLFDLEK